MVEDHENKRKVITHDGHYGVVYCDFGSYCSVKITRNGYYKVYAQTEIEDVSPEDFKRGFR